VRTNIAKDYPSNYIKPEKQTVKPQSEEECFSFPLCIEQHSLKLSVFCEVQIHALSKDFSFGLKSLPETRNECLL